MALHRPLARGLRAVLPGWLLLALAGCVSFLPTYDAAIHEELTNAVHEIAWIEASTNLPYDPKPDFKEVEPHYISAFASLARAQALASGRAGGYRGSIAGRPAELVEKAIGNCRAALVTVLTLHRSNQLAAEDFADSQVDVACAIPKMMEARIKD